MTKWFRFVVYQGCHIRLVDGLELFVMGVDNAFCPSLEIYSREVIISAFEIFSAEQMSVEEVKRALKKLLVEHFNV